MLQCSRRALESDSNLPCDSYRRANRTTAGLWGACLAVPLLTSALTVQTPPPARGVKAPVFRLTRVYKAGEIDRYKVTVQLGVFVAHRIVYEGILQETTQSVFPDGSADISSTLLQPTAHIEAGKKPSPLPDDEQTAQALLSTEREVLQKLEAELVKVAGLEMRVAQHRDAQGRVQHANVAYPDGRDGKIVHAGPLRSTNLGLQVISLLTPGRRVDIGESWAVRFGASEGKVQQTLPVMHLTLLGIETVAGARTYKIKMWTDFSTGNSDIPKARYEGIGNVDVIQRRWVRLDSRLRGTETGGQPVEWTLHLALLPSLPRPDASSAPVK